MWRCCPCEYEGTWRVQDAAEGHRGGVILSQQVRKWRGASSTPRPSGWERGERLRATGTMGEDLQSLHVIQRSIAAERVLEKA
jgi:hypothetical protein